MPGPGEYRADVTEGITRVENLPTAKGVHYVILTRRPLEDSTVVGWQEKIVDQPTCGGVPHGRGSHYLL